MHIYDLYINMGACRSIATDMENSKEGGYIMPKGSPTSQTIASDKYQKKAGYTVKGFKIKREVAEKFEKACEDAGVSQAAKITELMLNFAKTKDDSK